MCIFSAMIVVHLWVHVVMCHSLLISLLDLSPSQCGPSGPIHIVSCHELVSAVRQGSRLPARYEAKGLNSPGSQTTKVRLN